ncbi:MAG TPA: carboxypeptidase-like regulatory domain-containing protein [Vicinamibacteria bacterium]|nr:carboxypeptidase-like regulatory domain-containing protein [Vicinamibacteria bacterium]
MLKKIACLAILFTLIGIPSFAQKITATIRGTVTDTTGGVVPGANVTVRGEDTGVTRSTVTNSSGVYSFPELQVGTYTVEVAISGFKTSVVKGIALNVADDRGVDVKLETGAMSESITVEVPAVAVKIIGGEVAGLVTGEQVRELPLNGRNFLQLSTLMPGVSQGDDFNTKDRGLMSSISVSVSGGGLGGNMWTVDGANNNDVGSNRTILVFPSVDAIEEFKIHRNSYGAEFGGAAGAQVNIVTRGGTNEFHGGAYYFGRNEKLASADYFLKQADQPKGPLKVHDFGWTLGGPIIKDRLHFFVSQEWNREQRGITRATFVPTAAERAGDFSGSLIEGCSSDRPVDPLTGEAFPGNRIPANRLSPAGLLVLQLYPAPNVSPSGGSCNNWVTALNTPINWRQEHARLDWSLSQRTHLMLRYTQDSWKNNSPSAQETLWGDDPFPAVDSNWDQPGRSLTAQLTQNIGAKGVNSLTFAYSANVITVTRGGLNPQLNDQLNAAIPGIFPDSIKEYGADRGHAVFFGRGSYGDDLQNMAPFKNNQNLFVLKDDYSAVFGKHFFKAGVVAGYNQKNEDVFDWGSGESSQFGDAVGLTGNDDTTGNPLADLLLRGMAFDFTESSNDRSIRQRWRDVEAYLTDSWKIHPRVTLDYGLRWSRFESPWDVGDTISSFDPAHFNPALGGDACNGLLLPPGSDGCRKAGLQGGADGPNRGLAKTNNYFAPRVGLAWDVSGNGKMAVRAGVGQFFLRESLQGGLNLGFNPPFNLAQLGSRTLDSNAEPFEGAFAADAGIPSYGVDPGGKFGNNWQWNLSVEREIARNTTLEIGYVGTKGQGLGWTYDANQVPAGDNNHNGVPDRLDFIHAGSNSDARAALRPYGAFGNASIGFRDHIGSTVYHSLQTQLVSRFGRGSQFQASYTFSRMIGDVQNGSGEDSAGANAVSLLENRGLDRGLLATHRKHVFNSSLVLVLPELENKSGFVKNVLGGWEIATIAQASSGRAITVFTGAIPGLTNRVSGTGLSGNQRPNRVVDQPCRATGGLPEQILNPAAWTLAGFQLGTFGNSGRGICEGPNFRQVDASLYKNIKLGSRVKAQLRFEVFNLFNRVNFINVNTSLNPTSATLDTGRFATATTITAFTPSGSFGQATATRDPRQAQFGIKLTF